MQGVNGKADELVGWAAFYNQTQGHLFHKPKRLDNEEADDPLTGMSFCGTRLIYIDARRTTRPYEHPCKICWRGTTTKPQRQRRVAHIRPALVEPVSPLQPQDIRVTHDGKLGVKTDDGQWIVIDPAKPLMLSYASDDAAKHWRTWRSTWPTEALINAQGLADRYQVERTLVSKWRRDGVNFPRPMIWLADRPGWPEELLPAIDLWVATRQGRTGRPPKDQP